MVTGRIDFRSFIVSSMELEKTEFLLGSVMDAVVSQAMLVIRERGLQLIHDIPEEVKTLGVYGDQFRIQQILADFLLNLVRYAPTSKGWIEMKLSPNVTQISEATTIVHIEFR